MPARQPHRAQPGYVIAFDFGLRHIGVAVGQTVTGTASALLTLPARNGTPNWPQVAELLEAWQPHTLLVGLPLNMDDSESEMSAAARRFAAALARRSGLPTLLIDERLTSYAAERQEDGTGRRRGRRDPASHALAAVLIAESWLREGAG
ncbi:MAG: Holliday junction resolvase RuvX [Pseudomonadales bacterium]